MRGWFGRRSEDQWGGERTFSASTSIHARDATTSLVGHTPLPAETGPLLAPDRISVWPVEGGLYGIDAHYHGTTGRARAERQVKRLTAAKLTARLLPEAEQSSLRLGPLTHGAAWLALEAFLGRPVE